MNLLKKSFYGSLTITAFFLAVYFSLWPSYGQFRPEEILEREDLEDFLLTAKIVGFKDLGKGITQPLKINLRRGNTERKAVWKNCSGVINGYFEGWQYEIAAYRLDKLLGLDMIPPTVERRFQGQRGSLQLWVEHKYDLLEIVDHSIPLPKEGLEAVNLERMQYLARAFDSLIANEDRSLQNTLLTEDWRTILIDHSRSFRSDAHFTRNLIYGLRPLRTGSGPLPFKRLPRPFVDKLRALSFDSIKVAVGSYLTTREIRSILARRDLMIKEIEEMILLYGGGKSFINDKRKAMRNRILISALLLLVILGCHSLSAQFLPEEIAQREELEKFLLTAEIISYKEIGEGVTKPVRLFLRKDNVERSGVWKNPHGIQGGYLEGWQYEIAAYRLDKLLGLNMIPPTVEREFQDKKGSLQLWVEKEYSLLEVMEKNIPLPSSGPEADNWEKRKYLSRAFDALIANEDRTQQNTFYTKDWRTILIDHSRSFRSEEKYTKHLLFGLNPLRTDSRALPFRKLPREFVEKIKGLTFDSIKQAVGPYLTDKEIRAVLARKELILKEIADMIKVVGEDKILY